MPYLIDSNALIQAKNHFYRFNFCPGYWDWVLAQHETAALYSVEAVRKELLEYEDLLSSWVSTTAPSGFFLSPSTQVVTTQGVIARWVNAHTVYSPAEKTQFLSKADAWLIAEAIVNGQQLITFEVLAAPNSTKVKIPNVAQNFGVICVSLFDVIEGSGAILKL